VDQKAEQALWAAYELGELVFIRGCREESGDEAPPILHALSEAALLGPARPVQSDGAGQVGVLRLRYVKTLQGKSKPRAIEAIAAVWGELKWPKMQPGYSTVMKWKKKADGHPDPVRALRDNQDKKGRRGPRYDSDVMGILRDVRDVHYLCMNPRIGVNRAAQIAADRIRIENACRPKSQHLPIPKRKAMAAVIKELDAAEVLAARYGADKAMAMLRVSLGGVKTTRPLERMEIDHTVLSIILCDDDFEPIGRAFFTGAKDAFTRAVVGFYWGAENPSVVSLARCIRHSIQPKVEFLKAYPDVKNDWPCFGAAESWVIDNGLEEHAIGLQQAASEGGVQIVEFCARVSPWQKPNIERFMRSQDQGLIHGLPGTTMENIMKRTDFDPKKDILMRWSSFGRLLVKWIVDVYMQKPQKILKNLSPYKKWNNCKGHFTQFVPDRTTILECLFLRQVDGRSLDHEGIEFDCLVYNSMDMKVIRERFGPRLKVSIRVNDEDLSCIYVQVPSHDIWVKVPCLDDEYTSEGLTRWQHNKCKTMRRACIDEGVELSLAEARQQILDDIQAEKVAVTQGRRKARARMQEKSAGKKVSENGSTKYESNDSHQANISREDQQESCETAEIPHYGVEYLDRGAV